MKADPATDPMDDRARSDPNTWLDQHGDALYRFALMRVRNPSVAEDLVQETLLAALRGHQRFAGQSSIRTWLIAILKNKIVDHFRGHAQEAPLPDTGDADDLMDALFRRHDGHWQSPNPAWSDPDTALDHARFWVVFQECLQGLPARQAEAFSLTEFDGLPSAELCKVLGVSSSNLWVLLHRARLRLRECLQHRWFGAEPERR